MKNKIKEIIIFFRKYLGEITLISGAGLFIHNVLNFSYETYGRIISSGGLPKLPSLSPTKELEGIAYYYSSHTIFWASIGAMLIVSGILIIKNKPK